MNTTIIGVDYATLPTKTGLALGHFSGSRTTLEEVAIGTSISPAELISQWVQNRNRVLLALDAPLGWPSSLGEALGDHLAGQPVGSEPNLLFRRESDREVRQILGKQPLDVGADRIARTAHSALALLADLRESLGESIPLAWEPDFKERIAAVEIYPAGTLIAHCLPSAGYKARHHGEQRRRILNGLKRHLEVQAVSRLMLENADALDAAICVLAASDFLRWRCIPPKDPQMAKKEGWIWVKAPSSHR